jgi:uncharacterized phage-like protein YoqJ
MESAKTLAFTGLRPHKLPWGFNEADPACLSLKITLRERLARLIEDENVRHFISGMAMGIDMICAEAVLELKARYPDITLEAVVPSKEQDLLWPQKRRDRYAGILRRCDSVHVVSEVHTDDCIELRNHCMAGKCDMLLAVWNGPESDAIQYARRIGREIIVINPFDFS